MKGHPLIPNIDDARFGSESVMSGQGIFSRAGYSTGLGAQHDQSRMSKQD